MVNHNEMTKASALCKGFQERMRVMHEEICAYRLSTISGSVMRVFVI